MNLKLFYRYDGLIWRFFKIYFPDWFQRTCPIKIAKKQPPVPTQLCDCGKPYTQMVAYDTGDGYALFWICDDDCGSPIDVENWWPFWFGVWATPKDFERVGIEVV